MWSMIKSKALIILGGLVTVLVSLLSISGWRGRRARKQRDVAQATARKQREVMISDVEIDKQTDARLAEVTRDIRDGRSPDTFLNPNRMRRKRNK